MGFLLYSIHLNRGKFRSSCRDLEKSPSFMKTLNTAVNLNTNKIVSRVAELHDDFSDTIFNATQDKLRLGKFYIFLFFHRIITALVILLEHKRSRFFEDRLQESASKKTKASDDKTSSSKVRIYLIV